MNIQKITLAIISCLILTACANKQAYNDIVALPCPENNNNIEVQAYYDQAERLLQEKMPEASCVRRIDNNLIQIQMPSGMIFADNLKHITKFAFKALDGIALVTRYYPNSKITITTHTDSAGEEAYNLKRSQLESDLLKNMLTLAVQHHTPHFKGKIQHFGYGEQLAQKKHINPNDHQTRIIIEL